MATLDGIAMKWQVLSPCSAPQRVSWATAGRCQSADATASNMPAIA